MKSSIQLCAFADEASASRAGQIEALKANGIGLLEIRGVDGVNIASLSREKALEFRAELDAAGIRVWSIGSPAGKSDIHEDFEKEITQFEHLMEMADIFGASCIRLFSFYGTNGENAYFPEVCRRLRVFCDMAKAHHVIPCHENEKGIYGDTPERCRRLHEAVPDLRAVLDPANYVQCGADPLEAWHLLSPFVYYGHIKDALKDGTVVPPGDGDGRLAEYLPSMLAAGCADGGTVLTMEPHLGEFVGLADLEEEGARSGVGQMSFPDNRTAFDYAVNRLKQLLESI